MAKKTKKKGRLKMCVVEMARCGAASMGHGILINDGLAFVHVPFDGNMEKNARPLAREIVRAVNAARRHG